MASRFRRGAMAYAKDGRSYIVNEIEDGIVYCVSPRGAETEFPEAALFNEAEWAAKTGGRRELSYARLRQAPAYTRPTGRLDRAAAQALLVKADRLSPGVLDFTAYTVAARILAENQDQDLIDDLSVAKCREVFEGATPETRASLLAGILGSPPEVLINAGKLGDNLMRAMLEKGLAAHFPAFEKFGDRRRR